MSEARIDAYIAAAPAWQRENLTRFRAAVHRAAPDAEEGWKWGVPVFLRNGRLVCAMSCFARHTKFNFFDGAALADPHHLFNSGLDSKRSRSVNLAERELVDPAHLDELLREGFAAGG